MNLLQILKNSANVIYVKYIKSVGYFIKTTMFQWSIYSSEGIMELQHLHLINYCCSWWWWWCSAVQVNLEHHLH